MRFLAKATLGGKTKRMHSRVMAESRPSLRRTNRRDPLCFGQVPPNVRDSAEKRHEAWMDFHFPLIHLLADEISHSSFAAEPIMK
jgi:hypothetical protein